LSAYQKVIGQILYTVKYLSYVHLRWAIVVYISLLLVPHLTG